MSERMRKEPMDERMLEDGLKSVLTYQPDPEFVEGLEQRLLAKRAGADTETAERRDSLLDRWRAFRSRKVTPAPRLRWAAVPLGILALLLISLLLIGPERAWAGLQAWLGYVPGVGFVDLEESRLLVEPVRVTRDGVTLEVKEVVAGTEETVVVLRTEGLPAEEELRPERPPTEPLEARLHLPDGERLGPTGWMARPGEASVTFPPLPAGVYRVTLALTRLPLVPAGAAPEGWQVPLLLQPAGGAQLAEMYPQPYRPEGASATEHGVTLSVLEAAQAPEETALQVQLDWENPAWENHWGFGGDLPYLQDRQGNKYSTIPGSTSGSHVAREARPGESTPPSNRWTGNMTFEPVPPSAEALTLVVDGFDFHLPAEGGFTLNLGEAPEIGDRWDLDVSLDVAGFPVRITGVTLVEEEVPRSSDAQPRPVLMFDVTPVRAQGDRKLTGFMLAATEAGFRGQGAHYTPATNTIRASLTLGEGMPLPSGQFNVDLDSATVFYKGPWEVTWNVPAGGDETGEDGERPETYVPDDAGMTRSGVTLSVLAAAHSTEVTALSVRARWTEPGRGFHWSFREEPPYLRDERGNTYEQVYRPGVPGVTKVVVDPQATPPPGGYTEDTTLAFEPVPLGTRRLTLVVPALGFEQQVKETVALNLGSAPEIGQMWPLDQAWNIAGHSVRVTGVRLTRGEAEDLPYRLVFEMEVEQDGEGTLLEGILLEPEDLPINSYGSESGSYSVNGALNPVLHLPALPDRPFTVSTAPGASLVIAGPWEVTWDVPD